MTDKNKTIKMALKDILDASMAWEPAHTSGEELTLVDYDLNSGDALVEHPPHYNQGKYETIDVIEDWGLDFHCGNAIKYISRHKYKGSPKRDIEKAIWYLQRYMETL